MTLGKLIKLVLQRLIVLSAVMGTSVSLAVIEANRFDDAAAEQRYHALIAELRCLVCQNQNLADSDADLAKDLRRKTAEMINSGKSDQDILHYMRERYGDFVLYRPPFNVTTALLWIGPFVLLVLAACGIFLSIRRRQQSDYRSQLEYSRDDAQRKKVQSLLQDAPDLLADPKSERPES